LNIATIAELSFVDEHPHPERELAVAVRQETDALGALIFRPLGHDEGVIDRDARDLVDPARLERRRQLGIPRDVAAGASRRESARKAKDHDTLLVEDLSGRDLFPLFAHSGPETHIGDALSFVILQHEASFFLSSDGSIVASLLATSRSAVRIPSSTTGW
jgi:hypothetical protein